MASNPRANPSTLRKFNQATVAYVIPALLIVLNLMDAYHATEFNVVAGAYLLISALYDDEAPANSEPKKTGSDKDKALNTSHRLLATGGACIVLLFGLGPIFNTVADLCFELFYNNQLGDETLFYGYAGPNHEIRYSFQATRSDRCIPDQSMIVGAIDHHVKKHGAILRKTECLDLTETFSGFLRIGPAETFDMDLYCGPTLSFKSMCDGEDKETLN
ncbi:hypothetical protein ACHAP5_006167 [Fusarium lateritium]